MPPNGTIWMICVLVFYLLGVLPTAYIAARILNCQAIRTLVDRNVWSAHVTRNH